MSGSFLAHLLHIEASLQLGGPRPAMTDQPRATPCGEHRLRKAAGRGRRVPGEPTSVSAVPVGIARLVRFGHRPVARREDAQRCAPPAVSSR